MQLFKKKPNILVMPSYDFTLTETLIPALRNNIDKPIYVFEEFNPEVFPGKYGVKTLNAIGFRKMFPDHNTKFVVTLEERLSEMIEGIPPSVDFMQQGHYHLDIKGLSHLFPPMNKDLKILQNIQKLKDKGHFRNWVNEIYKDINYKNCSLNELTSMEYLGYPCVIQVAVGFGSMGVVIVNNKSEWDKAKRDAISSAREGEETFGKTVVNSNKWVVVEYFSGEEYAVDGFITNNGKPVVTCIFKHPFNKDDTNDTSDRVYLTSKEIMESYLNEVLRSIKPILKTKEAKDLYGTLFHMEFKHDKAKHKHIMPIEWNIFRLGGYGLAQLPKFAFGINAYDYYFNQKEVDWEKILDKADNKIHYWVLGIADEGQSSFNYDTDKFTAAFKSDQLNHFMPIHRNIVFGSAYAQTNDWADVQVWLEKDFDKFLKPEDQRLNKHDGIQLFEEAGPRAYMYSKFMAALDAKIHNYLAKKSSFKSYEHFLECYAKAMKLSSFTHGTTTKLTSGGEARTVIRMNQSHVYRIARGSQP